MKKMQLFKLISSVLGILFGLLLAEVGYRVFHYFTYRDLNDVAKGDRPSINIPNEEKALGQVIQLSPNGRMVYELIPSSSYRFQNALVQTNRQGFRDINYPTVKAKNRFRIIGLGDSVMFGWGIEEGDCYLTKLENNLNANDSLNFEIINTAVPGYNTVMEVATLENKMALDEVDMVIVNFVGNDLDLPNFIRNKPNYFGIKKSFILQRFEGNDGLDKHLRSAPFNNDNHSFRQNLDKIPPEYRDMVGKAAFDDAMQSLKKLAEVHGFKVSVLSTDHEAPAPDFVKESCKKLDFDLVEIMPIWKTYKTENPDAQWPLSAKDGHPSVVGHAVIAGALKQKIMEMF